MIAALRERLRGTEDDLAALDAFLGDPGDTAGAAAMRAILDREVAADPSFGQHLKALAQAAAEQPPRTITGSVVIDGGAKVSRNQISLGPLTINNNRQGRSLLAVLVVVVIVLVALAGYGGARVFIDEGEGAGPGTSSHGGSTPPVATPVADPLPPTQRTADAILPDRAAMKGTPFESGDPFPDGERGGYQSTVCSDYPKPCNRVRAGAGAGYAPNDLSEEAGWHAELEVLAHSSEGDAERTFDALKEAFGDDASADFEPDPSASAQLGDELASFRTLWEGHDSGIMWMIRRGPYIALIAQQKDGWGAVTNQTTQTQLSTLLLRRMNEALTGDTPHAALRDFQNA
ncbi:hypothetical protein [Streptomyces sp. CL12-4]|uniref:hypothetical protein n=1 Tax=Streptomyces sp. CL12-4 TaxID=2810306 RepID=UPI001EFBE555|nr:hypothetical protein [Streptomyces sp. CL12-4]MCG8968774.1 hypothetical protein [Streptomyces sp. CL12-4]